MTAHPAKFSEPVLERIDGMLTEWGRPDRVIDPFAGTGRVHRFAGKHHSYLNPDLVVSYTRTVGVEIEPEWATLHPNTIVGDALHLPFPDNSFDGLITSPCYGNRLADHHNAQDGSRRHSYRHVLGRPLHPNSSGQMQWGKRYRAFHDAAWTETLRVLAPDSLIILNVSNHIRGGEEQHVTEWHMNWFLAHGCFVLDIDVVDTARLRHGANYDARSRWEYLFALRYVAPVLTPDDSEEDPDVDLPLASHGPGLPDHLDT